MQTVTIPDNGDGMAFTGERFVPGMFGEIELEHLHRYLVAVSLSAGKDVLDIACGEGYGSHMLAQAARSVCGVDIDTACIERATKTYKVGNISFKLGSCTAIPLDAASVDLVVSFETLEHIEEQDQFLTEVKRVLRPDGTLLISTPDKVTYNAGRVDLNPFHVAELSATEYQTFIQKYFKHSALLNQRTVFSSALTLREPSAAEPLRFFQQHANAINSAPTLGPAIYILAVASDIALPTLENSFFEGRYSSNLISALHGGIVVRDGQISAQRDGLAERDLKIITIESEVVDNLTRIKGLEGNLRGLEGNVHALEKRLVDSARSANLLRDNYTGELAKSAYLFNELIHAQAGLGQLQSSGSVRLALKLRVIKANLLRRFPALNPVVRVLRRSGLFDAAFYLQRNPDVKLSGIDPLIHYVHSGAEELRDPNPRFSTGYYVRTYADLSAADLNPLYHFIMYGAAEQRNPHPLFSTSHYLKFNPDVAASTMNPLLHYFNFGIQEGRRCRVSLLTQLTDDITQSLNRTDFREAAPDAAAKNLRFETVAEPKVSIVIPVHGKSDYTLRCLLSIALNTRIPFEVIVVDDLSNDDTPQRIGKIPGVRFIRNETNLGFVRSSNAGAKAARGEFVVMLNNDTVVLPNWLSELLDTFKNFPGAGLAGSMLLYPDGRLQEAGGIIWHDGSGWNYGRLQEPDAPEFNYVRDVDYCSGACLMMPRELWNKLGGFDEHFAPAYYEDTDLAYRVRKAGYRVLYQPFSRIVHFEGISSGTSLTSGVKRHQALNLPKFVERWKDVIAGNAKPEERQTFFRDRVSTRHALVIDACTPTPDQDSGSCDTVEYLRALKDMGYHVTFVPTNLKHFGNYTENLQKMGVEVLYIPLIESIRDYIYVHGSHYDLVLIFRYYVAAPLLASIRGCAPRAKIVFGTVDLHFLREEREAEMKAGPDQPKPLSLTRQNELDVMRRVDHTIVVSEFEKQMLAAIAPDIPVSMIPIMRNIPGRKAGFAARRDVVFVGGFQHTPNVDAITWFVLSVWPLVEAKTQDLRLIIAGSNITESVNQLASERVVVRGFVPELGEFLEGARLSIAPLRYGAGVKGKIVASLSHGVPCVATTVACEGMGLQDEQHVLMGNTPESLAAAIVRAYYDQQLWEKLSDNGIELSRRKFSVDVFKESFSKLLKELNCL